MPNRWYRNAVIYSLDVGTFQDSNADGFGDLPGLISRLDYLSRLGVTAVWLNPIHPSPRHDGGYDVADHYNIDPRFGNLGDFAELLNQADERGLRILLDLAVNHTSDQHPWFQAARADPASPFRDWYVWSEREPAERWDGGVFPDVEPESWSYDERAQAWYRHRFYRFEPDLNTSHPQVRAEIRKIAAFWLRLGVSGFRIDAAPFLIENRNPGQTYRRPDYQFLRELRDTLSWRKGDAVLLAEANVEDGDLLEYFGQADGSASRLLMLFAFRLNQAIMLALARQNAAPIRHILRALPDLPAHAQWATFLRNHDEVDLGRLSPEERQDVFTAFGPDPDMQAYQRGIRRRLAPMLGGDQRRLRMAYSLLFTLPGTPVIRYGDEIGMGEDLALPERAAIRTPMQWSSMPTAGFSDSDQPSVPPIRTGPYSLDRVNVTDQRRDPDSLLMWHERMLHTLRECEEIGTGEHETIGTGPPAVLVHRVTAPSGAMLFLHNLAPQPCRIAARVPPDPDEQPLNIAADTDYGTAIDLEALDLEGYGYRWIRLRRTP
ncbi:trehalose synthase [Nonomuraea turkmeniaca]|uniref:Trehalose synthase n=1 Tax=Nonomuraea turkmeniaca TaxID=103838 RepID=A0A5S4EZS7_9ACTN|nr:alpha-amylase family protein [Nonomuraea turkmeniaca]TMR09222.1 trehalose synthase [Nonomuraea turkmeniaca]